MPLLVQAIPALWLAWVAWRRRPAAGALPAAWLMLLVAWLSVTCALERIVGDFSSRVFWGTMQYFGYVFLPVAWLLLGLEYGNRRHLVTWRNVFLLSLEPLVILVAVCTDPLHGLIHRSISYVEVGPVFHYHTDPGPLYWLNVVYSYTLLSVGMSFLIATVIQGPALYRNQATAMIIGTAAPWVGNVLHLFGTRILGGDPTPYLFAVTIAAEAWTLWFYQGLDVGPVARGAILDAMTDAVLVLDLQGRVLDLNAAARTLLGVSTKILGQVADQVIPAPFGELLRTPRNGTHVISVPTTTGRSWYEVLFSPLHGPHAWLLGRLAQFRDVSDRVRAEMGRRESEVRLRAAVDGLPLDFWMTDHRMVCVLQNSCCRSHWGDVVGRTAAEAGLDPEIMHLWSVEGPRAAAGTVVEGEHAQRIDGEVRHFRYLLAPVLDGERRLGTLGVRIDITDLVAAQESARQSEHSYRTLLEQASDAIFVADHDHRFITVNSRACEMLDLSAEEIIGRRIEDLFDEAHLREVPLRMQELREGKHVLVERMAVRRDGSKVPLEVSAKMLADGRIQAIARDVSARKQAEEERLRLEEKMRLAQKLESLGILAGGIAHDFNNLLVGVLGNAGLALLELPEDSAARPFLQRIETAASRAADLCHQMLAYSGRGAFIIQTIDLSALVREMTHLLEVPISKKARLRLDLASNLPAVTGDATQLRQVVMNLITNAAEAVGDAAGEIVLRTRRKTIRPGERFDAYLNEEIAPGEHVLLEVIDTGPGMTEEVRAKIFDPFYTTKFTGRGLGLAAVLGIVRGHRGAIAVRSRPGRGSRFVVLFPAARPGAVIEPAPPAGLPKSNTQGGTILVIDDEQTVLDFARQTLLRGGFRVMTARDGVEGVDQFARHAEDIVAVVLDATMPRMDGEETFSLLHQLRPDLPVLLSSGYSETEAMSRFDGLGLAGFLQKPYGPIDLLTRITQVARRASASCANQPAATNP